eukprot:s1676_g10.t1
MTIFAGKIGEAESTLMPEVRSWVRSMTQELGSATDDHAVIIFINLPGMGILGASAKSFLLSFVANLLADFPENSIALKPGVAKDEDEDMEEKPSMKKEEDDDDDDEDAKGSKIEGEELQIRDVQKDLSMKERGLRVRPVTWVFDQALKSQTPVAENKMYKVTSQVHDRLVILEALAAKWLAEESTCDDAKSVIEAHNKDYNPNGDMLAETRTDDCNVEEPPAKKIKAFNLGALLSQPPSTPTPIRTSSATPPSAKAVESRPLTALPKASSSEGAVPKKPQKKPAALQPTTKTKGKKTQKNPDGDDEALDPDHTPIKGGKNPDLAPPPGASKKRPAAQQRVRKKPAGSHRKHDDEVVAPFQYRIDVLNGIRVDDYPIPQSFQKILHSSANFQRIGPPKMQRIPHSSAKMCIGSPKMQRIPKSSAKMQSIPMQRIGPPKLQRIPHSSPNFQNIGKMQRIPKSSPKMGIGPPKVQRIPKSSPKMGIGPPAEDSQEQLQDGDCPTEDAEDSQEQRQDGDCPTENAEDSQEQRRNAEHSHAEKPNMFEARGGLADPHQMQADSALLEQPVTPTNFQQQADALKRDIERKSLDLPCAWTVYRDGQLSEEEAKKKEAAKKAAVASPARCRMPGTPSASGVPPRRKTSTKAKDGRKKAKEMVKKPQKSKGRKRLKGLELKKKLHSATPLHFIVGCWSHPMRPAHQRVVDAYRRVEVAPSSAAVKVELQRFRASAEAEWKQWRESQAEGRTFYFHVETRQTTWEDPSELIMGQLALEVEMLNLAFDLPRTPSEPEGSQPIAEVVEVSEEPCEQSHPSTASAASAASAQSWLPSQLPSPRGTRVSAASLGTMEHLQEALVIAEPAIANMDQEAVDLALRRDHSCGATQRRARKPRETAWCGELELRKFSVEHRFAALLRGSLGEMSRTTQQSHPKPADVPESLCRLSLKNPLIFSSLAWALASAGYAMWQVPEAPLTSPELLQEQLQIRIRNIPVPTSSPRYQQFKEYYMREHDIQLQEYKVLAKQHSDSASFNWRAMLQGFGVGSMLLAAGLAVLEYHCGLISYWMEVAEDYWCDCQQRRAKERAKSLEQADHRKVEKLLQEIGEEEGPGPGCHQQMIWCICAFWHRNLLT